MSNEIDEITMKELCNEMADTCLKFVAAILENPKEFSRKDYDLAMSVLKTAVNYKIKHKLPIPIIDFTKDDENYIAPTEHEEWEKEDNARRYREWNVN